MRSLVLLLLLLSSCAYLAPEADPAEDIESLPEEPLQDGMTSCDEIPEFCHDLGAPVCGSDGETYADACEACRAQMAYTQGPCPTETATLCDSLPPCERQFAPVCGSDGETYSNGCAACAKDLVWFEQGACAEEGGFVACSGERPIGCPDRIDPVCGTVDTGVRCITAPCPSSRQQTFGNSCLACANERVYGYEAGAC